MKLFHENLIFGNSEIESDISLFETVRLSVSISPRNLYNSLKSIKEITVIFDQACRRIHPLNDSSYFNPSS